MTFLGVRLPLFQGAAPDYVIPLLAMAEINKEQCKFNGIEIEKAMIEIRKKDLITLITC
jgi:hypothetical protein